MSFPPPPPMISPGYAFTPMGVGMVPMGMAPVMIPTTAVKLLPQTIPVPPPSAPVQEIKEKPPVTTVFVGNISDRAPDNMVKLMLQRCGTVLSWKRVQGASGKLQAFGFCEYEKPESTLRCIRLLNDRLIGEKKLVVKVDAKTKTLLDEYLSKKKASQNQQDNADSEQSTDDQTTNGDTNEASKEDSEELDEKTIEEDKNVVEGLNRIVLENIAVLSKEPIPTNDDKQNKLLRDRRRHDDFDHSMDQVDMELERKAQITQEIRSFRDLHKGEAPTSSPRPERERPERVEREPQTMEERRLRDSQRLRDRELYKTKLRSMKSRSKSRSPPPPSTRSTTERRRSRSRDRSVRSHDRSASRDRDRRDRERAIEIEEEAHERRKLEKKLREKEAAYRERLKTWETRESKKHRDYRKEKDRESQRKNEEDREARRLKEFLEDYDDERDDVKYYKGMNLTRRIKEREKEIELDDRDRAREKDELEEIKQRLQEEGHPDVEAEIFKLERQRNEHLRPRPVKIEPKEPKSHRSRRKSLSTDKELPELSDHVESVDSHLTGHNQPIPLEPPELKPLVTDTFDKASPTLEAPELKPEPEPVPPVFKPISELDQDISVSSQGDIANAKRKKLTVGDVFNQDDEEMALKKRKLIPLDYAEEEKDAKKPKTVEEKRAHIKTLIERIPTAKDELFAYPLDWAIIDHSLMDKRIKPWVNKKIVEYIGEEEPTLTDFICQKVISKSSPHNILNDVSMVLDEESEVFIVKMWRLLIYETEAKKAGLVK